MRLKEPTSTKGFFELKGIDQATIDNFSTRRAEIIEKLREWNNHSAEAAAKATLLTRKAKENKDLQTLKESWEESIKEAGGINLTKTDTPIAIPPEQRQAEFNQAIDRLAQRSFTFSEMELRKATMASGVGSGMSEADYNQLLKANCQGDLVALGGLKGQENNENYYTTKENIRIEKEIFQEVARTKNTIKPMNATEVQKILNQSLARDKAELSFQQRNAVTTIATSKDQYICVQGLAGTGKTHMLNYTRQVLESDGYTVKGACFTGKAAEGLATDAKIDSSTIHSLLNKLEREAGNFVSGEEMQIKTKWNLIGLKPAIKKEAWFVDEASMVDNNTMLQLFEAAKLKNAKMILVGDKQQLQPIGVGNAFATLIETKKINTIFLTEIRRQKNLDLLRAVKESVLGDPNKSLDILSKNIVEIEKHAARLKAITKDYTALTPSEQTNTVILIASNKDRMQINESIRAELKKQGNLKDGVVFEVKDASEKILKREFAVGDKTIFLQNDNKMGLKNGQTGHITKIDGDNITIKSNNRDITINAKKYNKFDHGYSMTAHKAQGITVDRVLINIDSTKKQLNSRNSFYVDISRARHSVKIYTDNKEKIQGQIQTFAKKITSEDFMLKAAAMAKPTSGISAKNLKFGDLNNAINGLKMGGGIVGKVVGKTAKMTVKLPFNLLKMVKKVGDMLDAPRQEKESLALSDALKLAKTIIGSSGNDNKQEIKHKKTGLKI